MRRPQALQGSPEKEPKPPLLPEQTSGAVGRVMERTLNPFRGTKVGNAVVGLSLGLALGGAAEQANIQDAQAERNRYFNERDSIGYPVYSDWINKCQRYSVRFTRTNTDERYAFPGGSIESQVVRVIPGNSTRARFIVRTRFRDVNLDEFSPVGNRLGTEFIAGCHGYLTYNSTNFQVAKKPGRRGRPRPIDGASKTISPPSEDPRYFNGDQFRTSTVTTTVPAGVRITRRDLRSGRFCLIIRQKSESAARPYDPNQVDQNTGRLHDPNQMPAMLQQGEVNPGTRSKPFTRCIRSPRQVTFRAPSGSPWSN